MKRSVAEQLHFMSIWHLHYSSVRGTAATLQPRVIHHHSLNVLCFLTAVPHPHDLIALFWNMAQILLDLNWASAAHIVFVHILLLSQQYRKCVCVVSNGQNENSRLICWFIQVESECDQFQVTPGHSDTNCWKCIVCGVVPIVHILNCFILHYSLMCNQKIKILNRMENVSEHWILKNICDQ